MQFRNGPIGLVFHTLFILFILAPIVMVCAVAFTSEGFISLPSGGLSLRWFRAILTTRVLSKHSGSAWGWGPCRRRWP